MSSITSTPKKPILKPIIISNNKKMVIKSPKLLTNIQLRASPILQFKEEVIYASSNCDFLKGESQDVLIVNRLNLLSKRCRTIAKCTSRGNCVETTSDSVSALIGQKNYETVLTAISSIFNEETKVRGILALLSSQKKFSTVATQTDMEKSAVRNNLVDISCQTTDTQVNMFAKGTQRKRIRRQPLTPYVVTESQPKLKKLVINISNLSNKNSCATQKLENKETTTSFPDLKSVVDEDSRMSCGSIGNLSLSSLPSVSGILDNPDGILNGIDKVTDKTLNSTEIKLPDGSIVMIPVKPEDEFHIATPEILKNVTHVERMKLIWYQAYIDFKMCLNKDEDGYYPLHIAVLNNDADLVRRQCASLRARREPVDLATGAGGLTALHMAVRQNASIACVNILLQNGADPLLCDQERRSSLHLAAETDTPHLRCLLSYCDTHARSVLKNNLDFWRPELEPMTDEMLTRYLYERVSEMFDDQGYTPLMRAAEAGAPAHAAALAARAAPGAAAPGCGATALLRAVAAACLHAKETGNRTTVPERFLKTIEILVEHGADPGIENHSGLSVNSLLTEFNISALSLTIANKMTALKHGRHINNNMNMILYKHDDGRIGYKDINNVTNAGGDMTEVRNIPPNLHAIISIDVPKKEAPDKDKKTSNAKLNNTNDFNTSSSKMSARINWNGTQDEKSNVNVSNDTQNESAKVRISGLHESKNNVIYKNSITDKEINSKDLSSYELAGVKNANTGKDASGSTNLKLHQIKLGKVILRAKAKLSGDNNALEGNKAVKVSITKLDQHFPVKRSVDKITDLNKEFNIVSKVVTDKTIPKETSDSKQQIISDILKNIDKSLTVANDTHSNDTTTNKNAADSDDGKSTKSAKERKTEKVVIIENVALKKGFPIPNILQAGRSKTLKSRNIDLKKDEQAVKNFRKRKLRSE